MKKIFKIFFIVLLLIILIYIFTNFILTKFLNKYNFEKDNVQFAQNLQNSPFSISKIIIYSSGYGKNKNTNFQKTNWVLDIFQYSDIAIYISPSTDELDASNTVKKLSLENINFSSPTIGSPFIYYLDSLNFGTATIDENHKIDNSIEFTVLNDENKNNEIQSNTPVFFTDCSNPITLKYVNKKVKENFVVNSNEPLFFNGQLLKMANINLKNLGTTINFNINIQSNDNKNYFYKLSLPLPLENNNSSIYDGSILVKNEYLNYRFIEEF